MTSESTELPEWALRVADETGSLPAVAWPGSYPIVYLADDGEVLCAECVDTREEVHFVGVADGWRVDGCDVHYEGPDAHCAHCWTVIPSAYGDPWDIDSDDAGN